MSCNSTNGTPGRPPLRRVPGLDGGPPAPYHPLDRDGAHESTAEHLIQQGKQAGHLEALAEIWRIQEGHRLRNEGATALILRIAHNQVRRALGLPTGDPS